MRHLPLLFLVLLAVSCRTATLPYLSDAQREQATVVAPYPEYRIAPGDQLYIYVYSATPEAVIPFNQETNRSVNEKDVSLNANRRQSPEVNDQSGVNRSPLTGYIVSPTGLLSYPILGSIPAAGLTIDSLAQNLQQLLIAGGYITDPLVTITLLNNSVAVVGEVVHPMRIPIAGQRLTILEALAIAGDLTPWGRNDNVLLLRNSGDSLVSTQVNLASRTLLDSPCYYLQQGDVVYVEPNKAKKKSATQNEDVINYIAFGTELVTTGLITWYTWMRIQQLTR